MPPKAAAVNDEVVADTTTTDSAPEENKSEVAEVKPSDNGEYTAEDVKTEGDDTEEVITDETAAESQPQGEEKPLAPKSENRFQQLANENRDLKAEIESLKSQEAQIATEQGLLNEVNPDTGEYYTTQEIERIAFQQSREDRSQSIAQQRYDLEVQQNQQTISSEAIKGLEDFPIFDENSKEFNPELAALADKRLERNLILNDKGVIVGSQDSPYEILQTIAVASQSNAAKSEAKAQKATEKMLANADSTGSSQQGEPSFEKLSLKEQEAALRRKGYDI